MPRSAPRCVRTPAGKKKPGICDCPRQGHAGRRRAAREGGSAAARRGAAPGCVTAGAPLGRQRRNVENWAKLPAGWSFKEVGGVGADAQDNVYVFNRGAHPMMVFDRHGNFLRAWGEGVFPRAHGLTVWPDDTLFCTDDGDHSVR